jgi:hypothetical protein
MISADTLLTLMKEDGFSLPGKLIAEVKEQIAKAVEGNLFNFVINKNNHIIGFYTIQEKKEGVGFKVFINNLYIFKRYRDKGNLLYLRNLIKQKYGSVRCAYWRSRKKQKIFDCNLLNGGVE